MKILMHALAFLFLTASVGSAKDLESEFGAVEFEKSCASCHGFDGKGKGYMADKLKQSPADLTTLSERNNGFFPFTEIYRTIEGTARVGVHGSREMPDWGEEYRKEAQKYGVDERVYTRGIIMELILHIYSLQE